MQLQAIDVTAGTQGYAAEHFITLKKRVQGPEFTHRLWRERSAHVLAHEAPEPLAQGARLVSDFVQVPWRRLLGQSLECVRRNKVGLSQPRDETVAAVEPVNRRIGRRCDRVQEIEARRVGNEICGRSRRHDSS